MAAKLETIFTPDPVSEQEIMSLLLDVLHIARTENIRSIGLVYTVRRDEEEIIEAYHALAAGSEYEDILDGVFFLEKDVLQSIIDEDEQGEDE